MVTTKEGGFYLIGGHTIVSGNQVKTNPRALVAAGATATQAEAVRANPDKARDGTIAWNILSAHNSGKGDDLRVKFDALASHDITYVGIIQTARASGLKEFPVPYVLTNCHNSLCAVGGTINEDDHVFGLSAARKYGGYFVPAHQAVIHTYMREEMAGCGRMILGSDSHTRYGALGTLSVGEGGPELVKQILGRTWDLKRPPVVLVWMTGRPAAGTGPMDVALAIIKAVFDSGFVKNKIMEFAGPGVASLSADFRNGIDVMTTETTCLSSVWVTDGVVKDFLRTHGRADAYKKLEPDPVALYDGLVEVDLSSVKPMIAMPFHPAKAYTIEEVNANAGDILRQTEVDANAALEKGQPPLDLVSKIVNGKIRADQGVIAGCAGGTFENIMMAASILKGKETGSGDFWLSVYPGSQPVNLEITRQGAAATLMEAGVTMRTAFCGPCFGAGDVPANNGFSIRHVTRNFPNRDGSKPGNGQVSSVAIMDARSIAATAANGGWLTPATEVVKAEGKFKYRYDRSSYDSRVYKGFGKADQKLDLTFGPNIADWPAMSPLTENILLEVVSVIRDPVTTTDELIPSGETSSYRSNPYKLAEFTLSRKDPGYVARAKKNATAEAARRALPGGDQALLDGYLSRVKSGLSGKSDAASQASAANTGVGSLVFANKPGDGSAREQAASCQKVLGGWANAAIEYATKRYRSNLVNWGMLPFIVKQDAADKLAVGQFLFVPGIAEALKLGKTEFQAWLVSDSGATEISLSLPGLEEGERDIILAGCLINYYNVGK